MKRSQCGFIVLYGTKSSQECSCPGPSATFRSPWREAGQHNSSAIRRAERLLATVSTGHRQGQRAALLSLLHACCTSDLANVEGGIRDILYSDETCKYDIAGYVTCHVCIEWEKWYINDYFHGKKSITTKYPLNANSVTQSLCT